MGANRRFPALFALTAGLASALGCAAGPDLPGCPVDGSNGPRTAADRCSVSPVSAPVAPPDSARPGPPPATVPGPSASAATLSPSSRALVAKPETAESRIDPSDFPVPVVTSGLDLPHQTPHGVITGETCTAEELAPYLRMLKKELARYPAGMLQRVGIRKVLVAKRLNFCGQPWSGIPVFGERTLWLDAVRGRSLTGYQARLFHHELFHLIDNASRSDIHEDPAWAAVNPRGFRYGPGGENYQNTGRDVFAMSDARSGFVTGYAESALEEDKAELFSCLTTMPRETVRRAGRDSLVRRKIELLREQLDSFHPGAADALLGK
jgi:hypothetical protein